MSLYPTFANISLNAINTNQLWSIHPFQDDTPSPALKQSFTELGILHPPIVQEGQKGTYNLISGRKRLHALKHYFNKKNCFSLIIPPEIDPHAFFLYILTDQQLSGPLSPMETAFFLKYCLGKMDENEVVTFFLPRLGYKKQEIHQLISLIALDKKIQHQIHHGFIIDKIAFEFLELPSKDRLSLSSLFELLQPGTGKQKRFINLSRELANRSQQSISSLLNDQEFKQILAHKEMNSPQKMHTLLEVLQKKIYPRSSNAEQAFNDEVRELNLPDHYTITHSPNFEKDEICLSVTFPDLARCKDAWHKKQLTLE